MKYRIEDKFDVDATRYWDAFNDEAYQVALFEYLDIDYELVSSERTGEGDDLVIVRDKKLTPRRDVPKVIERVAKGAIGYREQSRFVARENRIDVTTIPTLLADKITTRGVYRLEEIPGGGVNRIYEGECTVSIPIVGKSIEKVIVDEVKASYVRTTTFTREWFAKSGG